MRTFSSITRTKSRQSRSRRFLWLSFFVGAALIVLLFFHTALGRVTAAISSPAQIVRTWLDTSAAAFPSYIRSKESLMTERDELQQKLRESESSELIRTGLRAENSALREMLSMPTTDRIAAGVVTLPNQTPYDILLLDQGAGAGVVLDAPVFAENGIAVGRIAKVYGQKSLVELFSTPGVAASAYIFGPDTFAQAEGIGGGVVQVSVPQGISLSVGDSVILPSASAGIIGSIAYIETRESDPLQYGFVPTAVTLSGLRFVSIGTSPLTTISYEEAQEVVRTASTTLYVDDIPTTELPEATTTEAVNSPE